MSGNPFRASLLVQTNPAAASPTPTSPADGYRRDEESGGRAQNSGIGPTVLR